MEPDPPTLQGHLLLADPSLRASWFGRCVILITSHEPGKGTQGFVLNRPVEGRVVEDLLPSPDFKPLRRVPVYQGGPVAPNEMILMALRWNEASGTMESRSPMGIAGATRALAEGWDVRAFTGYTGWGAGQLEGELKESSWIIAQPSQTALTGPAGPDLWAAVLRSGDDPRLALLAGLPDDPGLN